MSGLLALLDDVAAIAKVASASVDDVIGQASKAGAKAAGAVIDDAAVTPKYVHGFAAARELPIVWKIARASAFNKLVILLPAALLLSEFAPWAIPPLLILGGLYLCYEGAEKLHHWLAPAKPNTLAKIEDPEHTPLEAAHLEEQRVKGAIKTDFILSAEIMTISLAATDATASVGFKAAVLAVIAVVITAAVYGAVAAIVKADDVGLHLAQEGRTGGGRRLGRAIVKGMPGFMKALTAIGTAAMLWVGGNIVVHALHEMGWHLPYDLIHGAAVGVGQGNGLLEWVVTALLDGVVGIALGFAAIPVVAALSGAFGGKARAH
jgi:predicted DNA repair protein MutK